MSGTDILAVRIERRRIAIACFSGIRLDYTQVRELSSRPEVARFSARSFITWSIEVFSPEIVAVEASAAPEWTRRADLQQLVLTSILMALATRTEIKHSVVRAALGIPGLRTRKEVRDAMRAIWPRLPGRTTHPAALDAAALGLHLQMKALLNEK